MAHSFGCNRRTDRFVTGTNIDTQHHPTSFPSLPCLILPFVYLFTLSANKACILPSYCNMSSIESPLDINEDKSKSSLPSLSDSSAVRLEGSYFRPTDTHHQPPLPERSYIAFFIRAQRRPLQRGTSEDTQIVARNESKSS